ncbi:FAD-dependent oxidoreductase [Nocardia suismassiliense]|uniref:FAD-dependent oxidoreductase n=1 Tax=Nocardia suismassiliense TaxID=2077092 RepID=UPI001F426DFC|nr:FAD-dependent oxidoreductase [Nocardia suismassiliense]
MSAALELAERGFEVDLYERHQVLGGRVRRWGIPGTGTGGRADLPAEVGPHGFWGAYQNLGESMGRIPIGGGRTILDNLLQEGELLRFVDLANAQTQMNAANLLPTVTGIVNDLAGITAADAALVTSKIAALLASGPKRKWGQLEYMSLGQFMCADRFSPNTRGALHQLTSANTEPLGRMNARAATLGMLHRWFANLIQVPYGPGMKNRATFVNGPFNETLWAPWAQHLETLGARIHTSHRMTGLSMSGGQITGATVLNASGNATAVAADWYVLAMPFDKVPEVLNPAIVAADPALGRIANLEGSWLGGPQIYLKKKHPKLIQGMIDIAGPWCLVAGNYTNQIWNRDFPNQYGDGTVVEYLTVDMAIWDAPGILYGKPAIECTIEECFEEIRAQFRQALGDDTILLDEDIHTWTFNPAITRQGGRLVNDEPEWGTTPGCWADQPEDVTTNISNLLLASPYVRTDTWVDDMDAANSVGKRAANAILGASGVSAPPAPVRSVYELIEPIYRPLWDEDDRRYAAGLPNVFDVIAPIAP